MLFLVGSFCLACFLFSSLPWLRIACLFIVSRSFLFLCLNYMFFVRSVVLCSVLLCYVVCLCLFVCLFVCLLVCLFVCLFVSQ